jgi:proline iminopeptidase
MAQGVPMPMLAIRDVSLFVKVVGHGYPIVLMHGGPGLDYTTLDGLLPLAKRFTLIFYDHRANGRSTGAPDTMTFDNLVADADALRQTLGFEEWAVLGHSFGGHVALEYALRYPANTSHLMLLDTAADSAWAREGGPAILEKLGYSRRTVEAARRFFAGDLEPGQVERTAMRFMRAYFFRIRLRDIPSMIRGAFRLKMRPEAHVFGFAKVLKNWSVTDRLGELAMPTLVLGGREDFLFPPEELALMAERIPNARLEIVEQSGHMPFDEQQDQTLDIITDFIASSSRSPSGGAAHRSPAVAHSAG